MYFSLSFIILSLLLFSPTLFAFNTTNKFWAPIIAWQKDLQCTSSTHFFNTQQHVCIFKYSLNSTCQHDYECLTDKYYDQLCKEDKDCSISNYCKSKHCGSCIRDVQCANHHCHLFHCTTVLNVLQKHS